METEARKDGEELPLWQQAEDLIRREFPHLEGVEDLAQRLGVSKCHLIRTFRAIKGVPPGRYLTRVRVAAARVYLENREYPIQVVAGLTGFADGNYFAKVFRRETGFTPRDYRERFAPTAPGQLPEGEQEFFV